MQPPQASPFPSASPRHRLADVQWQQGALAAANLTPCVGSAAGAEPHHAARPVDCAQTIALALASQGECFACVQVAAADGLQADAAVGSRAPFRRHVWQVAVITIIRGTSHTSPPCKPAGNARG